jgi:hypothetical protein
MTVQDLLEILNEVEDKSIPVLVNGDEMFLPACMTDSGIAIDEHNNEVFMVMPCFCHVNDEAIEIDVKANHFETNDN